MADKEQIELSRAMRMLAAERWANATAAERKEQGRKMAAGRAKARKAKGKKR